MVRTRPSIGWSALVLALVVVPLLASCSGGDSAAAGSGDGLPAVTGAGDAKPSVSIPDAEPPTALQVKVLREGDGGAVAAGDLLTAHYVGLLWRNGQQFDSSWDRGEPATFPVGVGGLIAGWDEGLVGKQYGSRVLLVVPPDKGYGAAGQPDAGIAGTDTLVFVVDLVRKAG